MKNEIASQPPASRADIRRYIDGISAQNPLEEPMRKYWRAARRAILLMLLGYTGLQYYFFDVYLTIMAMPSLSVLAALP
jgi:hypothetical protein